LENIKSNKEMEDPYLSLCVIISFMKYEFRSWIQETLEFCILSFGKLIELDTDTMLISKIMKSLTLIFPDECEAFISKHKIVPWMLEWMNIDLNCVRISFNSNV
jgi:hypothetical protein